MISCDRSENPISSGSDVCTTASIFEKPNSIKFEILFGHYQQKTPLISNDPGLINTFEYLLLPNEIFGFAYESTGNDYKKFHHAFVLRACAPGEKGHAIFGIYPGAEILVNALTNATSMRLRSTLKTIEKHGLNLSNISAHKYQQLNRILDTKSSLEYFIGELIGNQ